MTLIYQSPDFLLHDTGNHPESATRLRAVLERLEELQLPGLDPVATWQPASLEQIGRIHNDVHVEKLERIVNRGGGMADPDTVLSPNSLIAARLAAGAACDAVSRVVTGEQSTAMCLVRPPGHHALPHRAMGFCLFNSIAIAARTALAEFDLERVLIVDWDVHHGNGTQDCFYDDFQVGFFSAHRWPYYPGTGSADETGTGVGFGTTRNLPTSFGISRKDYLEKFRIELVGFADQIRPQLVLISAGFDGHREDPIGSLGLESEDFIEQTKVVQEIASVHAGGRIVSLLEGGYNPTRLAECVELHLRELIDSDSA